MHALLSSLMAALLLLNAAIGCCRHHVQSFARAEAARACAAHARACCQHEQDQHGETPKPCNCKLECSGACAYLPSEKSAIEGLGLIASSSLIPGSWKLSDVRHAAGPSWETPWRRAAIDPPLPLHLLHQSLLL